MLDLTQIHLATAEDHACRIDRWAALLKAATWEELKMLAKTNPYIEEAVATVRQLTQEEKSGSSERLARIITGAQ